MKNLLNLILALGLVLGAFGCKGGDKAADKKDKPAAAAQKADEKKAEEKKADEKTAEEKKADEKKAEEKKAEEPKADEKKAEEPRAEDKKVEELKAEDKKAEEPKADEKKAEEPKAEAAQGGKLAALTADDVKAVAEKNGYKVTGVKDIPAQLDIKTTAINLSKTTVVTLNRFPKDSPYIGRLSTDDAVQSHAREGDFVLTVRSPAKSKEDRTKLLEALKAAAAAK